MTILAFDPGYDRLGWAWAEIEPFEVLELDVITTNRKRTHPNRLQDLYSQVGHIFYHTQPEQIIVEQLFFKKNVTNAIKVAEVRGILYSYSFKYQAEFVEYHPQVIKQTITGDGRADKTALKEMLIKQITLPTEHVLDDAVDAAALAYCHALHTC